MPVLLPDEPPATLPPDPPYPEGGRGEREGGLPLDLLRDGGPLPVRLRPQVRAERPRDGPPDRVRRERAGRGLHPPQPHRDRARRVRPEGGGDDLPAPP